MPITLGTRRALTAVGDWRLTIRLLRRNRYQIWHRNVQRFADGTIYRVWMPFLLIKLMVKG
jgi:predicted P-loop ATPase